MPHEFVEINLSGLRSIKLFGMYSYSFSEAVSETVRRHGMDLSNPLAMVSGGPDSVALLRVLLELDAAPTVLHVEHGVRGRESLEDAEFVRELCEKLGVRCEVKHLELEKGSNFQERAREARYRAAGRLADEIGAKSILTGHTADDVAETALMNLARGSGLRGLAGIPPVRGRISRPLIQHTREEILKYLKQLEQPYRSDSTNLTGDYARNRMRREVLPILEELYPGARTNVARGASLLREDLAALENLAAATLQRRSDEVFLTFDSLASLPHALRRHAIRQAYTALAPDAPGLSRRVVEAVLGLQTGGEGTRTMNLPSGVVVAARTTGELAFYFSKGEEGSIEFCGGELTFGGWKMKVVEGAGFDEQDAGRREVAYLDGEKGPYTVRMVREGDTIRPLGLGGSKKVLRAMMDRRVPKDVRRRTPVVVGGLGDVAWIFCGDLGERYSVRDPTKKVLRLEVKKSHEHG